MSTRQPIDSMAKQEIVDTLYRASDIIQRYDVIDRELERAEVKYEKKKRIGYKKPWYGTKPLGKKILILFAAVAVVWRMGDSFNKLAVILFDVWGLSAGMSVFLVNILQFMLIILILVLAQIVANIWIVKWNKKIADEVEYKRVMEVQEKLDEVVSEYLQISWMWRLPEKYGYKKETFLFMAKAIEQGRVDTFEEAVSLYEKKHKYGKL